MKKIEVTSGKDRASEIENVFKTMGMVFSVSKIRIENEECFAFSALVPDQFSDKLVEDIQEKMDLRLRQNTISVYNVEAQVSTHADRLKEKAIKECPPPNPFERLVETAEPYRRVNRNLLIMALFATMIALAGLFLDNSALVIGAMLLSPLLGPINAFAVNATLGRIRNLGRIQGSIFLLLFSVIGLSALFTFVISRFFTLPITTQIELKGQTALVDVGVGLVLGLAGGLALVAAIPELLVGVGVASALLPPAAVAGIGLAFADSTLFWGALTLTIVYLVGLQLGCTIMLRAKGLRPRRFYQKADAQKRSAYFIIILSLLLAFLIWITLAKSG